MLWRVCRIFVGQAAVRSAGKRTTTTVPCFSVSYWRTLGGTTRSATARDSTSSPPSYSTSWTDRRTALSRYRAYTRPAHLPTGCRDSPSVNVLFVSFCRVAHYPYSVEFESLLKVQIMRDHSVIRWLVLTAQERASHAGLCHSFF